MDGAAPVQEKMRGSLILVFAVVLVDMIGFGIIMPTVPDLLKEITGESTAQSAVYWGWLSFVYAAMQFAFAPIIGNLSDRFGRRPVLLAALAAYAVNYTIMGLAPTLLWLFIGRIVAGVTGASFSVAYAYVADVTPAEKRAESFGLIGVAFGLGFILGPGIGGIVGHFFGTRAPFFAAGGLAAINFAFGYFMLHESLPAEKRRPFDLLRANAFSALRGLGEQNRIVLWYAGALFVWFLAHMVYPIIWAFFVTEAFGDRVPFGMSIELFIGATLALVGVGSALVQGVLIRVVVPRIGEARSVTLGIAGVFTGTMIYLFAEVWQWVPFAIVVGSLQGLIQPSINGLMSRAVADTHQGQLQGAVASLQSLSSVLGPPVFTYVFFVFTAPGTSLYLPGAPFGLAGLIALVSLALFWRGTLLFARKAPDVVSEPAGS